MDSHEELFVSIARLAQEHDFMDLMTWNTDLEASLNVYNYLDESLDGETDDFEPVTVDTFPALLDAAEMVREAAKSIAGHSMAIPVLYTAWVRGKVPSDSFFSAWGIFFTRGEGLRSLFAEP